MILGHSWFIIRTRKEKDCVALWPWSITSRLVDFSWACCGHVLCRWNSEVLCCVVWRVSYLLDLTTRYKNSIVIHIFPNYRFVQWKFRNRGKVRTWARGGVRKILACYKFSFMLLPCWPLRMALIGKSSKPVHQRFRDQGTCVHQRLELQTDTRSFPW